jgi:hypothetical protein
VTYQQKCKIAPNAADFDCPELECVVERSRRWDPIFRGGMSRPASNDDAIVFPKALSEAATKDQKPVAEKADLTVEAADVHASVGVTDMVNAAPTTPGDLALDELRRALDIAASKALEPVEPQTHRRARHAQGEAFQSQAKGLGSIQSPAGDPNRLACTFSRQGTNSRRHTRRFQSAAQWECGRSRLAGGARAAAGCRRQTWPRQRTAPQ